MTSSQPAVQSKMAARIVLCRLPVSHVTRNIRRNLTMASIFSSINEYSVISSRTCSKVVFNSGSIFQCVTRCLTPRIARLNGRFFSAQASASGACWKCGAQLLRSTTASGSVDSRIAALFCTSCYVIQPLDEQLNHFQIMGLEERFDIDERDLTSRFRNLQRQLHPDKFSNKSEIEQNHSAAQSSAVNRAYKVLLKPLSRGLYMLELKGFSIEEGESNIDPLFLMEVMEVNEELADTDDIDTIRRIGKDNAVVLNAHLDELKGAFSKADYSRARATLMRLKYYANIDDKVKEKLGTN